MKKIVEVEEIVLPKTKIALDYGDSYSDKPFDGSRGFVLREDFEEFKEGDKIYVTDVLTEASFGNEKTAGVVQKMAAVLSRRLKKKIIFSSLGIPSKSAQGKWVRYYGMIGNTETELVMNFIAGKNSLLDSIDVYENPDSNIVSYVIELNGYNIVEVIDQIAAVLTKELNPLNENTRRKQERVKLQDVVKAWLQSDVALISNAGNIRWDTKTQDFLDFARANHGLTKSYMSSASLAWYVKQVIKELGGNSNSIPGVSVVSSPSKSYDLIDDPELSKLWAETKNSDAVQLFEHLAEDVRKIAQGHPMLPGLYIFGKAGIGKTQTVTDVLEDEGVRPIMIDQKMTSPSLFMEVLMDYAKDEVIVFDDNDSIMENEQNVNYLKKVLDMKPVRRINILKPMKVPQTGRVLEGSFDFESKIIFVSNKTSIDPALASRLAGVTYNIDLTNEETLELIKSNLYKLSAQDPNLTDAMREEVFAFFEQSIKAITNIDYRVFNFALANRTIYGNSDGWKKKTILMLKAQG